MTGMDASSRTFVDAKNFLLQPGSEGGEEAASLFDHLSDVIGKILESGESLEAAGDLQQLSTIVEQDRFVYKPTGAIRELAAPAVDCNMSTVTCIKGLMRNAETAPTQDACDVEDILSNHQMFQNLGVSLGTPSEVYTLALNVRELASQYAFSKVRLFGKFNGVYRDYYVAEATFLPGEGYGAVEAKLKADKESRVAKKKAMRAARVAARQAADNGVAVADVVTLDGIPQVSPKVPSLPPQEAPHTGANTHVYFVCTESSGMWLRLPEVTPVAVAAARKCQALLTGDLGSKVAGTHPFPGDEAMYLRAQIARIGCATVVAPRDYYYAEEDEEDPDAPEVMVQNPEYEPLPSAELFHADGWVHTRPYLLPQGRTEWWDPREPDLLLNETGGEGEDEYGEEMYSDEEEEMYEEAEPEDSLPILSSVAEDLPPANTVTGEESTATLWSQVASPALRGTVEDGAEPLPHATVGIRSNRWPGAVAVAKGEQFASVYVGNGLMFSEDPVVPPMIPEVASLARDPVEQTDPTVEQEKEHEGAGSSSEEELEDEFSQTEDSDY